MQGSVPLVEIWRGDFLESVHFGDAVVCDGTGQIVEAWGDPTKVILPRSAVKMLQALPLVESGAADAIALPEERLALACASHHGTPRHRGLVADWLGVLGMDESCLQCGAPFPLDRAARIEMTKAGSKPDQLCNPCSGKHAGFLTTAEHLGASRDYNDIDHPVQQACLEAFEDLTGETSPGFGIDGCSAPNFACSLHGLARAMAWTAAATEDSTRGKALVRLHQAMRRFPENVSNAGAPGTELIRAGGGEIAVKNGAEGVYVGIAPNKGLGIAVKIADGADRAVQVVIAALMRRFGLVSPEQPYVAGLADAPILNRRGIETGRMRAAETLL